MMLKLLKSIFAKKEIKSPVFTIYKETREGNVYYHLAKNDSVYCGNKHACITTIPLKEWRIEVISNKIFCQECEEKYGNDRWPKCK